MSLSYFNNVKQLYRHYICGNAITLMDYVLAHIFLFMVKIVICLSAREL